MKKLIGTLILGSFAVASSALGAFSIDELQQATKVATDDFVAAQPAHAVHFTGYKAWLSGDDSKVKIYVDHDGMTMDFNYVCHKHDAGIECHAQ